LTHYKCQECQDELLPWGTLQCAGKLAGHRLLDWSVYALILVFPVIWYFLFGKWFKSQLGSLVSGVKGLLRGLVPNSRKKNRCSHCEHHTRAKAKDRVQRWRRQALPIALVVHCWHRSSKKARRLVADISVPVHWKWKKKKVGLSSIVKTKFASTSSCVIPKCQSCELARARQRSLKVRQVQSNLDRVLA
jgi:hypothetical protein